MKILITGGAGFIASHIADAYIRAGHCVTVVDNLATGSRKNVNPKAKFYRADVRNRAAMERIFKCERPEMVNHHAALVNVVESLRNPIPTLETNVLGTANALLAFSRYGRGNRMKFVFASSGGAIYGDPKRIPADEATPRAPLSPYGLSKLLGEEIIRFYAQVRGFPYLVFRYPNVYGPRQNLKGEAGIVAIFGRLLSQNKRPTIFGDGTKCRDYLYVGDVVRANLLALRKGKNVTLNLGWSELISDQQVFDAVAARSRFRGKPIYAPYRKGEVYKIALKARKAKKILGWQPKTRLEEGIRKTLATI